MKGLFLVVFAPLALALSFGIFATGLFGVGLLGQGISRTAHRQSFLPPESRPKPTGFSRLTLSYLTSSAGRTAARRHLLVTEHGTSCAGLGRSLRSAPKMKCNGQVTP